jgi:DUF438 domain-containing protein
MEGKRAIDRVTPQMLVGDLIEQFPFLIEELGNFNPHYMALRDPMMRQMMARVATLEMAAMRGGVRVEEMMQFIAGAVQRHTGRIMMVDGPQVEGVSPERLDAFRRIMQELHAGGNLEDAQRKFAELVKQSLPGEIAEMEQHLIKEGIPVTEIKRMCDVHLQVVSPSLQQESYDVAPGHPVHSFVSENRLIEQLVERLRGIFVAAGGVPRPDSHAELWRELEAYVTKLWEIDKHYLRKEHQLFSHLERYGFTGPSTVMWGIHDDIRAELKQIRAAVSESRAELVSARLPQLLDAVLSMVQKEERILFPTALKLLKDEDWETIAGSEKEIGYIEGFVPRVSRATAATSGGGQVGGLLEMNVGALTLDQVNLILTHLPVELSFVDEKDEVRFYSNQAHKIFARTPDAIGRKVQNCHPPKSVHLVTQILSEFRAGQRDVAEFWIQMHGMFVHIRYFAVRDSNGKYRGSLEVVQDVAAIRGLEGERRLLAEQG